MQTLQEIGNAVALRRKQLGLKQGYVAALAGITPESLSRLEHGHVTEFGSRKLLAVLTAMGAELIIVDQAQSGTLDELRIERSVAAPLDDDDRASLRDLP